MYPAVRYNNRYFLLTATFFSAVFIVLFTESVNFFEAWTYLSFYPALGCSMVIAGLLIGYIHWITTWLDRRCRWELHLIKRIIFQFLLGLLISCLMAFALAALYYRLYNYSIFDTAYLRFDYPVIVLMLLFLNVYYFMHYRIIIKQDKVKDVEQFEGDKILLSTVSKKFDGVLYYYRWDDISWKNENGKISSIGESLAEIEAQLSDPHYFRINRQLIVHANIFNGFIYGNKKRTVKLLNILPEAIDESKGITIERFTVSEDRRRAFQEWLKALKSIGIEFEYIDEHSAFRN